MTPLCVYYYCLFGKDNSINFFFWLPPLLERLHHHYARAVATCNAARNVSVVVLAAVLRSTAYYFGRRDIMRADTRDYGCFYFFVALSFTVGFINKVHQLLKGGACSLLSLPPPIRLPKM